MKLKAVNLAPAANFLPQLDDKEPYWMHEGAAITDKNPKFEVDDEIGGRLLAAYPDNIRLDRDQSSKPAPKKPKKGDEDGLQAEEDEAKEEGAEAPAPEEKSQFKNKMAGKYDKKAHTNDDA